LKLYKESQDEMLAPLRERIVVLDDLLKDAQAQLDRVIDLYVSGSISRDLLVDKKQRVETTISALTEEKQHLIAHMVGKALTERDIQKICDFALQVAEGLDLNEIDFEGRRRLLELLDLRAKFSIEDNQKVVEIWCILGTGKLALPGSGKSESNGSLITANAQSCDELLKRVNSDGEPKDMEQ
jgi:hypothetical protein